jgi:hypothetical protein
MEMIKGRKNQGKKDEDKEANITEVDRVEIT